MIDFGYLAGDLNSFMATEHVNNVASQFQILALCKGRAVWECPECQRLNVTTHVNVRHPRGTCLKCGRRYRFGLAVFDEGVPNVLTCKCICCDYWVKRAEQREAERR